MLNGPTATGWLMVLAHFVAAGLCTAAAWQLARTGLESRRLERRVWWALACMLALFGLNRAFDLQSVMTDAGRDLALAQGWYGGRRALQALLVVALAAAGLAVAVVLPRLLRGAALESRWAAAGTLVLMLLAVARAVSLHQVDQLLALRLLGVVSVNAVLEGLAVGVVAAAAGWRWRRRMPSAPKRAAGPARG